ncbi:MAG: hypothetical protein ABW077_19235 [Candidatus Thiodiazotropha endolucinida]
MIDLNTKLPYQPQFEATLLQDHFEIWGGGRNIDGPLSKDVNVAPTKSLNYIRGTPNIFEKTAQHHSSDV